jgi:hypothetical protein
MAKKKIALLRTRRGKKPNGRGSAAGAPPRNLINLRKRNCPSSPELSGRLSTLFDCQNKNRGFAFAKSLGDIPEFLDGSE